MAKTKAAKKAAKKAVAGRPRRSPAAGVFKRNADAIKRAIDADNATDPVITAPVVQVNAAVREYLIRRIGEGGYTDLARHLDDAKDELHRGVGLPTNALQEALDGTELDPQWAGCGLEKLTGSERESLVAAMLKTLEGSFVHGHRSGSGAAVADREASRRENDSQLAVARAYLHTSGMGLTQGQRVARVAASTGLSRSSIYRLLDLGR